MLNPSSRERVKSINASGANYNTVPLDDSEAFVLPEGSKDLIVIETAAAMHSFFFREVLPVVWAVNKSTSQSPKTTNQEVDCSGEVTCLRVRSLSTAL